MVFVIWKARDIFYLKREQVMLEKKINEEETVEQVLIRQKGIRPQGLFHLCLLLGMIIPNVLNLYYSYLYVQYTIVFFGDSIDDLKTVTVFVTVLFTGFIFSIRDSQVILIAGVFTFNKQKISL